MPNARNPNRSAVSFWVENDLLAAMELGRKKLRGQDRSQFIRDAIKEKLEGLGFDVPDEMVLPPDRASIVITQSGVGHTSNNTIVRGQAAKARPRSKKK